MKHKLNIAVFIGEHKFWLDAASFIFKAADFKKYNLKPVFLSQKGMKIFNGYCSNFMNASLGKIKFELNKLAGKVEGVNASAGIERLKKAGIDFGFILTQKFQGGARIQKFLHQVDIPYNGSHFRAVQLAVDKNKVNQILRKKGFLLPKEILINSNKWFSDRERIFQKIKNHFTLPIIVKPASSGDSMGVNLASNDSQIISSVSNAFMRDNSVVVQEYLKGIEVSCAVLDDGTGHLRTLTPLMVQPLKNCKFFNNLSKKCAHQRRISKFSGPRALIKKIKFLAVKAHRILNLSGISQSDFIVVGQKIYFLEINPTQGFRPSGVFMRAIRIARLPPQKLFDWILKVGFNRFSKEKI